jgi:hypothetical protein
MAIAHAIAKGNQQTAQTTKKAIACSREPGEFVAFDSKILAAWFKFAVNPATKLSVLPLKNLT